MSISSLMIRTVYSTIDSSSAARSTARSCEEARLGTLFSSRGGLINIPTLTHSCEGQGFCFDYFCPLFFSLPIVGTTFKHTFLFSFALSRPPGTIRTILGFPMRRRCFMQDIKTLSAVRQGPSSTVPHTMILCNMMYECGFMPIYLIHMSLRVFYTAQ